MKVNIIEFNNETYLGLKDIIILLQNKNLNVEYLIKDLKQYIK